MEKMTNMTPARKTRARGAAHLEEVRALVASGAMSRPPRPLSEQRRAELRRSGLLRR